MRRAQKGRTFSQEAKQKMSSAQKGTNSHKFRPWALIRPDGVTEEFKNITVKDYAKLYNIHYPTILYFFSQDLIKRGRFKGYKFYYI